MQMATPALALSSACKVPRVHAPSLTGITGTGVGTILGRGVFSRSLVGAVLPALKLALKTQNRELPRKPSEGRECPNAAYVGRVQAGGGGPAPWWGGSTYPGDGAYRGGQQDVVFEFPTVTHRGQFTLAVKLEETKTIRVNEENFKYEGLEIYWGGKLSGTPEFLMHGWLRQYN